MTQRSNDAPSPKAGQFPRFRARILDSLRHDPYQPRGKQPAMRCGTCGAVFRAGRWRWADEAPGAAGTCPACRRAADRLPAGRLTLEGPYVAKHRDELVALVRHEGEAERAEHPMHRIIAVESSADGVTVTTTDIHLPRRIGTALKRAHDGDLVIRFSDAAYAIRVEWRR